MTTIELLQKTKAAWPALSAAPAEEKNRLLLAMADALEESTPAILAANAQDMADAEGHISAVMLDRLRLDEGRIRAMADGVRAAAALPDHTGRTLAQFTRPNGMTITKVQVPLGLVAIIYESRPTSPQTPRRWLSRAATSVCSEAGRRRTAPAAPSWRR